MKKIFILLVGVLSFTSVAAQGLRDVRINEILVKNETSYTDDHSEHTSWIELYNSGYASANLSGAFLRFIQGSDTTIYRIPKSDVRTNIPPQGYVIFYASASSNKGTFHTSFALDQLDSTKLESLVGINDKLELLDQSGKNVIDFIEYDVNTQVPDVSYGRILDYEADTTMVAILQSVTPMQSNEVKERIPKSELFRMEDPNGFAMALIAMSVVFTILALLYIIFKTVGNFMQKQTAANKAKSAHTATSAHSAPALTSQSGEINGEEVAAVTLALYQYYKDIHDIESEIITINRVARAYSPWSSKIHTLTQNPRQK